MTERLEIRESNQDDLIAIESIYPEAFPDENLLPLVRDLLGDPAVTMSLAGMIDGRVVGHAIFTRCGVIGRLVKAALLGPLAVAPAWQQQGIGRALVNAGLRLLEQAEVTRIYVLGDPGYYGRLGFRPERSVEPPYPLPPEWDGAWQSQNLGENTAPCAGKLSLPRQWLQPALWAP